MKIVGLALIIVVTFTGCGKCIECTKTDMCYECIGGASAGLNRCSFSVSEIDAFKGLCGAGGGSTSLISNTVVDTQSKCSISKSSREEFIQTYEGGGSYTCLEE